MPPRKKSANSDAGPAIETAAVTHVKPTGSRRMPALLVRGTDRYGHFDLYEPPVKELGETELATHDRVYNAYAENYREQVRRHEEEFAAA